MIAVFDLDKTLINEDSTTLWSKWLCDNGFVSNKQAYLDREQELMTQYEARQLNISDYIQLTLQPIIHLKLDHVEQLVSSFIKEQIAPRVYEQSLALLRQHQKQGDDVLIISASATMLVSAIAKLCFQIDSAFGIDVKKEHHHYTTQITGIIPYQTGKIAKLQEYINSSKQFFANTYFYSDSINDEPLLCAVQYPNVINPDKKLALIANKNKWPVYSFQRTVLD